MPACKRREVLAAGDARVAGGRERVGDVAQGGEGAQRILARDGDDLPRGVADALRVRHLLGLHAADTSELFYDDVRVGAGALLGPLADPVAVAELDTLYAELGRTPDRARPACAPCGSRKKA